MVAQLEQEGYRFSRMNVDENPNYWTDYSLSGTPAFIGPGGARLSGYRDYNTLKNWIDQL